MAACDFDDAKFRALRQKAEAMIAGRGDAPAGTPREVLELIQELQVHQVELGIQNEELKRAQLELADLNRRYVEFYFEEAPCGYVTVNTSGLVTGVNRTGMVMLGVAQRQINGLPFSLLLAPESLDAYLDMVRKLRNGSRLEHALLRLPPESGGPAWIRADARADRDGDERAFQYRLSLVDISDAVAAEEKQRRSETLYRKLAANLPRGAAFIVDRDLRYVLAEGQALREAGLSPRQLEGKTVHEALEPALASLYEPRYRQALAGKEFHHEHRFHDRTYASHGVPLRDERGDVYAVLVVSYDISDRIAAEEEQKRLRARLTEMQKMESIGHLAGGIAHDFNNILFPIVGMAELLLDDLPPGSPERESAEEIFSAGMRGSGLVKQILAFSRQSGHQLLPVRVQQIVAEVLRLIRSTVPANIEIRQDLQSDCGRILANPTQIHQVAMNILTNAFHAVEARGGTITVCLTETTVTPGEHPFLTLAAGRYAHLAVADDGSGISPELLTKVFEPYFTTKEKGKGTGLGLAVAYGIVRDHKGEIRVSSAPGRGATFEVYLPLMDAGCEDPAQVDIPAQPAGTERILLVDDEEPIARLEKRILERLGYRVVSCSGSIDAWEAFRADPRSFDLVISDMSMPNMTGDQLVGKIKSLRPDMPVIVCTGFSERINREKAEAMGVNGFLMKPVIRADLTRMVRDVLDGGTEKVRR